MKVGMIALIAALMMLAVPAWAGPADPCGSHPEDMDSDGICDALDNCKLLAVVTCDTDSDGYGNHCDGDFDQSGFVTAADFGGIWLVDFGIGLDQGTGTDMDCSGFVTAGDFGSLWLPQFTLGTPGPSGLACAGTVPCP
jgi:hypothetical protein